MTRLLITSALTVLVGASLTLTQTPAASAVPAATKTMEARVGACQKALRTGVSTRWSITCAPKQKSPSVYAGRKVTVALASYEKSPKIFKRQLLGQINKREKVLVAQERKRAETKRLQLERCNAAWRKALPPGWRGSCVEGTPANLNPGATGVVYLGLPQYEAEADELSRYAIQATGGAPLPRKTHPQRERCQKLMDKMLQDSAGDKAQDWSVFCMVREEMPPIPAMGDRQELEAGGFTYGKQSLILINSSMDEAGQRHVFLHEWGHALQQGFSYEYQYALEKRFKLPFYSFTSIYESVTEALAQSYAECRGGIVDTNYPGVACTHVEKIFREGGVTMRPLPKLALAPGKKVVR